MAWGSFMRSGYVTFFMFYDPRLKYASLDTLEDLKLKDDLKLFRKKITIYNNDPKLYIRYIHNNNTSPYVVKTKKSKIQYDKNSDYQEYELNDNDKIYANNIYNQYYKSIVL